uniref:Uncharacterized protein n=1 Tax=Periophthalmus magnuspinnatus TaxID=409849 RepID=A0A3B4AU74_9GOBI
MIPTTISISFRAGYRFSHLFALLCLVAMLFKLTILVIQRRKTVRKMEHFIGPPPHWLFGHVFEVQDGTALDTTVGYGKKYPYTILASTEPKDNLAYAFIKKWIGDGLLVSHGQKWFRHRRLLTPGFHYDVLKPYVKLMSDSANILLDKWEKYSKTGETFELFEHVSLMTLDSILKCAFSYNSNCQTEGWVYAQWITISAGLVTFPYHNDFIFYLSPHGFRFRKACRVAQNHTAAVIRKRKEELKEEKELERIQARRNLDFLDILLCARVSAKMPFHS